MLQIEIMDSGLGIDEERQQYLFTPFLELRIKQSIELCKNQSIGLGLSCSSLIAQKLGGSLKLIESNKNDITVFRMQMPVVHEHINDQSNQGQQIVSGSTNHHLLLFNFKRPIHQSLIDYIKQKMGQDAYNFQMISRQSGNFVKEIQSKKFIKRLSTLNQIQNNNGITQSDNQNLEEQSLNDKDAEFRQRQAISEMSDDHISKFDCDNLPKNQTFNEDLPGPVRFNSKKQKFMEKRNQRLRPKVVQSDDIPILDRLNLKKKKTNFRIPFSPAQVLIQQHQRMQQQQAVEQICQSLEIRSNMQNNIKNNLQDLKSPKEIEDDISDSSEASGEDQINNLVDQDKSEKNYPNISERNDLQKVIEDVQEVVDENNEPSEYRRRKSHNKQLGRRNSLQSQSKVSNKEQKSRNSNRQLHQEIKNVQDSSVKILKDHQVENDLNDDQIKEVEVDEDNFEEQDQVAILVDDLEQILEENQEELQQIISNRCQSSKSSSISVQSGSDSNQLCLGSNWQKRRNQLLEQSIFNGISEFSSSQERDSSSSQEDKRKQKKGQNNQRQVFKSKYSLANFKNSKAQQNKNDCRNRSKKRLSNKNVSQAQKIISKQIRRKIDHLDIEKRGQNISHQQKYKQYGGLAKIIPKKQHLNLIQRDCDQGIRNQLQQNQQENYNNINCLNQQKEDSRQRRNKSKKEPSAHVDDSLGYAIGVHNFLQQSVKSDNNCFKDNHVARLGDSVQQCPSPLSQKQFQNFPLLPQNVLQDRQNQIDFGGVGIHQNAQAVCKGGNAKNQIDQINMTPRTKKKEALKILIGEPALKYRTIDLKKLEQKKDELQIEAGRDDKSEIPSLKLKMIDNLELDKEIQKMYGDKSCNMNVDENDDSVSSGRISNFVDYQVGQFNMMQRCLFHAQLQNEILQLKNKRIKDRCGKRRINNKRDRQKNECEEQVRPKNRKKQEQGRSVEQIENKVCQIEQRGPEKLLKQESQLKLNYILKSKSEDQKFQRAQLLDQMKLRGNNDQDQVDKNNAPVVSRSQSHNIIKINSMNKKQLKLCKSHSMKEEVAESKMELDNQQEQRYDAISRESGDIMSKSCKELSLALQKIAFEQDVRKVISSLSHNKQYQSFFSQNHKHRPKNSSKKGKFNKQDRGEKWQNNCDSDQDDQIVEVDKFELQPDQIVARPRLEKRQPSKDQQQNYPNDQVRYQQRVNKKRVDQSNDYDDQIVGPDCKNYSCNGTDQSQVEHPHRFSYSILKNDLNRKSIENLKKIVKNQQKQQSVLQKESSIFNDEDEEGFNELSVSNSEMLAGSKQQYDELDCKLKAQPQRWEEEKVRDGENSMDRQLPNQNFSGEGQFQNGYRQVFGGNQQIQQDKDSEQERQNQRKKIKSKKFVKSVHYANMMAQKDSVQGDSIQSSISGDQSQIQNQNMGKMPFNLDQQNGIGIGDANDEANQNSIQNQIKQHDQRRKSVVMHRDKNVFFSNHSSLLPQRVHHKSSKKLHKLVSSMIGCQHQIEEMRKNNQLKENNAERMKEACCQHKILIVDDTVFNLQMLQYLIKQIFEIELTVANNGLEALELFKREYLKECGCPNRGFKLILMDINMPVMDGIESTKHIVSFLNDQRDPSYAHIVALTSYVGDDIRDRSLQAGMKDVLKKPLHSRDMQITIYRHFYRLSMEEIFEKFPHLEQE